MRTLIQAILLCGIVTSLGCAGEVKSRTKKQINVFAIETDAAYEGALNRPAAVPLATLPQGSTVYVLSDTYGKDYWACHIRTQAGQEGWVLCGSLDYRGG